MIAVEANMTGVGSYIGMVGGMLKAMEDPRFKGDYIEHLTSKIRKTFMTNTRAAHLGNEYSLDHVYEWGPQDPQGVATGSKGTIPLFSMIKTGAGDRQMLSYVFLPSQKPVPLPDPEVYGFKPEILDKLNRHVFQLKAVIMETNSAVTIGPVMAKRIFIPSFTADDGYVMTQKSVTINPGGAQSTGQFAAWWTYWFDEVAPGLVEVEGELTEQFLEKTGQKLMRYAAGTVVAGRKVGGQFASSRGVSVAYVNSQEKKAEEMVLRASEAYFDEDTYWGQWGE